MSDDTSTTNGSETFKTVCVSSSTVNIITFEIGKAGLVISHYVDRIQVKVIL